MRRLALHVLASEGKVGDEAGYDDRDHQAGPPVAPAETARTLRLAHPVGERCADRRVTT